MGPANPVKRDHRTPSPQQMPAPVDAGPLDPPLTVRTDAVREVHGEVRAHHSAFIAHIALGYEINSGYEMGACTEWLCSLVSSSRNFLHSQNLAKGNAILPQRMQAEMVRRSGTFLHNDLLTPTCVRQEHFSREVSCSQISIVQEALPHTLSVVHVRFCDTCSRNSTLLTGTARVSAGLVEVDRC